MEGSANYALASQLSVLRSCPDVISRLLKTGGSLLLAAKVLVMSRLLHTKLSKRPTPVPYLQILRNRLATLRRRLLLRIDRRFKTLDVSRDALLEAMCAFVLATSSSPTDVVRHFHHLRLEALAECMQNDPEGQHGTLQALRLYVKTLKDSQSLLPTQLGHALERLKTVSIFKSNELHSLIELNLDLHERWIDDDVKSFTPYIRHDDLSRAEAEKLLKQWARTAMSTFLDGLRDRTQMIQDPVQLMQLRKAVLELWLSQHQHALGIDSAGILDGLRDVFNTQAVMIIKQRVSALGAVASMVQGIIRDWQKGLSDVNLSLWDSSISSMDTTNGGKRFCDAITNRLEGRNGPFSQVVTQHREWLENVSAIEDTIKAVRETKWEDAIDDADDEDDLLDDKQVLLSKDDPLLLEEELFKALSVAYSTMEDALEPAHLLESSDNGQKSVFLLRVWRDLRYHSTGRYSNAQLGSHSISKIESTVVEFALVSPLKTCSKRVAHLTERGGSNSRTLWEGSPELPVLPNLWTYRLLLEVVQSMAKLGMDIWSPNLSTLLRQKLAQDLSDLLLEITISSKNIKSRPITKINGHADGHVNGEGTEKHDSEDFSSDKEEGENDQSTANKVNGTYVNGDGDSRKDDQQAKVKDMKIQRLFDVLYLAHATSSSASDENKDSGLVKIQASLKAELELETKSIDRLSRNAGDYWKRTKLLFALLGH